MSLLKAKSRRSFSVLSVVTVSWAEQSSQFDTRPIPEKDLEGAVVMRMMHVKRSSFADAKKAADAVGSIADLEDDLVEEVTSFGLNGQ